VNVRYAIVSDIHANLEALTAVVRKIDKLGVDGILCLGDIVGYNADPDACIRKIRGLADAVVRGNHDKAAAGLMNTNLFNAHAREAIQWTKRALDEASMSCVSTLFPGPLQTGDDILLCHGSPQDEDLYLASQEAFHEGFAYLGDYHPDVHVCFFGHTHVPFAIDDSGALLKATGTISLEKDSVYLINPGSVGQPRNGNTASCFGLYDGGESTFTFFHVPYPYRETQEKILQAGLPSILAQRLALGR
jgi:predicted phosphodiesterase